MPKKPIPPLTPEQQQVVNDNLGLVYSAMQHFRTPPEIWEEMESECHEALMRCAQLHDPARGQLSTLFYRCALNRKRRIMKIRLQRERTATEEDASRWAEAVPAEYDYVTADHEAATKWLPWLRRSHREAIERKFGLNGYEPHTLEEVGRAMRGVSKEYARQLVLAGIERLRMLMGVDDAE